MNESIPIIKGYAEIKKLSPTEEKQLLFEAEEKALHDHNSRMESAYKKGARENAVDVAKTCIALGLPMAQIVQISRLEVDEIEKLIEAAN